MAVIDLPPRPTVANPVLTQELIEKCAAEIDESINNLFCIYATFAGSIEIPQEGVDALYALHKRMRQRWNELHLLM